MGVGQAGSAISDIPSVMGPPLSGLDGLDRVQGVGTGGLPALPPDRDTDRGAPAAPVAVPPSPPTVMPGLVPLLSGLDFRRGPCADGRGRCRAGRAFSDIPVPPSRHARTCSGHPRPAAASPAAGAHRDAARRGCPEQVRARRWGKAGRDRERRRETPAGRNPSLDRRDPPETRSYSSRSPLSQKLNRA